MKRLKKIERLLEKPKILISFFVVVSLVTSIIFNFIFKSSEASLFVNIIPSSISVENWFTFWITLIAALSSVFVGICSLYLTMSIEDMHVANAHNAERLLFIPTHAKICAGSPDKKCEIHIFFPEGATLLEDKSVTKCNCCFQGNKLVFDTKLDTRHPFSLRLSYTSKDENSDALLEAWMTYTDSVFNYDCLHVELQISYRDINYEPNEDIKLDVKFDLYNNGNDLLDVLSPNVKFA